MKELKEALYQQMRYNVLSTTLNGLNNSPFSDAYIYAWESEVYPFFHDGADWHQAHKEQFKITEQMMDDLSKFLDDLWIAKKTITFYELEKHFGIRGSATSSSEWERWSLIRACRYLYLNNGFDSQFWGALLENMKCPSEAFSVVKDFEKTDIYFM